VKIKATIMKPADRCAEKSRDMKLKNGYVRTECVILVVERGEGMGGDETDDERNTRSSPFGVVMHDIVTRALV